MQSILGRVGAVVLGLVTLLIALVTTLGTAVLVPIGMAVGRVILRRRGRRFGLLEGWLTGVITFGSVICITMLAAGAASGRFRDAVATIQRTADSAQRHPAPLPPFLRNLGAQPTPVISPSMATPFVLVSMLMGVEIMCVLTGTIAWAGTSLVVFGVRGPRPPDPAPAE